MHDACPPEVVRRREFGLCPWALFVLLMLPGMARADCSRTLQVPVSAVGLSVTVGREGIGGLYPELLRGIRDCSFEFSAVPRARQEAMFASGRADVLIPASRTAGRDQHGHFVPLVRSRPAIIVMHPSIALPASVEQLLARRELRVAVVRGFDYGEAYQDLLRQLQAEGRLVQDVDPRAVAKLLERGLADLTVMAPPTLVGALLAENPDSQLVRRLRYEAFDDFPWGESGAYISRSSVSEADRAVLTASLERAARSGAVWAAFQKYYPPGSLKDSIKPY